MKKTMAGGVVILAIGLGLWLSNLFNGLGPGGEDDGIGDTSTVSVNLEDAELVSESGSASPLPAQAVPTVLISDREYRLVIENEDGSTSQVPTSVEQIVTLARDATPDADGIRIEIKREGSSRAATEAELDAALSAAGLSAASIRRHPQFVD